MDRRAVRMVGVTVLAVAALGAVALASLGLAANSACQTVERTERISGKTVVVPGIATQTTVLYPRVTAIPDEVVMTTTRTCR